MKNQGKEGEHKKEETTPKKTKVPLGYGDPRVTKQERQILDIMSECLTRRGYTPVSGWVNKDENTFRVISKEEYKVQTEFIEEQKRPMCRVNLDIGTKVAYVITEKGMEKLAVMEKGGIYVIKEQGITTGRGQEVGKKVKKGRKEEEEYGR